MDREERTEVFISSFDPDESEFLKDLEKRAQKGDIPIIRPAMRRLLRFLIKLKKPERILEIGAATGFSAILMAECSDSKTRITTIEKYEKRIPELKENIKASGYGDKIRLLEGEALDILKKEAFEKKRYDLIFLDAAKAQYINFLPFLIELCEPEGIIVSDNVLKGGDIIESRFSVERRDRTIHSRMRSFLYEITHNPELFTDILPIGDGVTLSIKEPSDE